MKPAGERKWLSQFDWQFGGCVLTLLFLGLLNLYSSTYNLPISRYFNAQLVWIGIGLAAMFLVSLLDYRVLERFSEVFYWLTVTALGLVLVVGRVSQGARRWLGVGPLVFQPSEIMKIAVILMVARHFQKKYDGRPLGIAELVLPFLYSAIPFALILKQPDLGTGLVVFATGIAMILFVGVRRKILITAFVLAAVSIPIVWEFGLHDYQRDRVVTFLNPEKYPLDKGYQVIQSKIGIGSGELAGKGWLKGTQSKLQFLPKQHTDFAFSNFAEEFGFVGSTILLALYASFGILGFNISMTARDSYGVYVAFGLTSLIMIETFINFGMESGLLPVVGMTLPLFSYGGSSLITTLLAAGILLNISSKRFIFKND